MQGIYPSNICKKYYSTFQLCTKSFILANWVSSVITKGGFQEDKQNKVLALVPAHSTSETTAVIFNRK